MSSCSIDGCTRPVLARGWCGTHYARWWRLGSPAEPVRPEKEQCPVPGCTRPVRTKGYCGAHYQRVRRHGEPLPDSPLRPEMSRGDFFWPKVDRNGPTGFHWKTGDAMGPCWVWTAGKNAAGYGTFGHAGKSKLAHRLAYEWERGELSADLDLDHLCRNPACVNPAHLEPVTHTENVRRGLNVGLRHLRTHCRKGHAMTPENTYVQSGKYRGCRTCRSEAKARFRARHT